ncbi:unnamed protein product [Periconia digitata]|uniref:ARM repeat-containing protein n=1 Tax=Periconia digitata TaxID=1303443 RepID=A0A9W4US80_9PLEO|nr:unnamed protein product [Periconia digitata]
MATFSEQPDVYLKEVEQYLADDPQSNSTRLKQITARLQADSVLAEHTAQLLGTAVGKQHTWQGPYRENGILEHVVQNLDLSTHPSALVKQYLRVIGNSVADNDTNRAFVVKYLPRIINCLSVEELRFTALVVMYNLLTEYEPAHDEGAHLRLDSTLSEYLTAGNVSEEAIDYAMDLLTWTTEKLTPDQLLDTTSTAVFDNILKLASQYDDDNVEEYVAILVHYLQDPNFQQKIATPNTFERLVDLMYAFESRLTVEESQGVFEELKKQADPNKITSEELGVILMVRLINSISAMSASDAFARGFGLQSAVIEMLLSKLTSPAATPSKVCCCVILGNLATSDEVCIEIVKDMKLHITLIEILSSESEQALLYAAAGFIRHLAFPSSNRPVLGEAGLIEACCKLLVYSDPSIRGEAAAILCKLVSDGAANIDIVLFRELPDSISPTPLPATAAPENPKILYHIVTQALAPSAPLPSTSMKNPMIELGRTIIAILRYIRQSSNSQMGKYTDAMFKTPAIARPVARLVRQRFYADAKAEGILGLGLMAQTPDGSACVVEELRADDGLLESIKEIATESRGGQENNATAGRDYQNAVVLLHGLANNGVDVMSAAMKSDVEELQTELGKLMVQ